MNTDKERLASTICKDCTSSKLTIVECFSDGTMYQCDDCHSLTMTDEVLCCECYTDCCEHLPIANIKPIILKSHIDNTKPLTEEERLQLSNTISDNDKIGDTITYCPYCASKLKQDEFESDDDGFNDWYDCTNSKCGQKIYWERN